MSNADLRAEQKELLENLRGDYEELREGADSSIPIPELDEALLARLVRADSAYATLPRKFLAGCGFVLKAADEIADENLQQELWRVISVMAILRLLIEHTDHLSDRELYQRLYEVELMEPANFQPGEPDASIYICDLLGGRAPEERRLLLTYYTDRVEQEHLERLRTSFKGDIPETQPRPYDRDRFLP